MKLNPNSFFKTSKEFSYLNLNSFYLGYRFHKENPCNPSTIQQNLFNQGLDELTYGGYGENRKDIWRHSYLSENKKFIHLGIDIQMPHKTEIISPFDCSLVDVLVDKDTDIGWGGRLILKRGNKFLILAHLDPKTLIFQKSPYIKAGQKLGNIGTYPTNGNTFEHLHVQVRYIFDDFNNFDGYGFIKDLKDNPDPFDVEF